MIGQTISHYRIVEKLGAGGMGEVFRAEDTRLGREVALKFLPESAAKNEHALERFTRESRAAAALNHPNICTLYDVGQHQGRPYIAMELMKGRNLHRHLSGRPLSVATILELSIQMTDALDTAHRAGIIHRDIKPGNLFVTDRGQIKVLDFGLAKLAGSGASGGTEAPTAARDEQHLTSPGAAVGTVSYMSPEQARGEEVDTRTDVFSLGVVLYEMATGEQAFGGSSTAVIFEAILNRTPDAPKKLNPELPEELQEIVFRAIEKDRDLRYQSAADLRAALKRLSRDRASDAGRDREAPSSDAAVAVGLVTRHKKKMGVTAAVLVAVAFGLFRWLSPADEGPIRSVAVLPFENAGGDPDTEYLSDGIAESLIDSLSELPELRVAPRGQSFQFRGPAVDLSRVGAELNV